MFSSFLNEIKFTRKAKKKSKQLNWFIDQDIKGNMRLKSICLHYACFQCPFHRLSLRILHKSTKVLQKEREQESFACSFDVFIFRKSKIEINLNVFDLLSSLSVMCRNLPTVNHMNSHIASQTHLKLLYFNLRIDLNSLLLPDYLPGWCCFLWKDSNSVRFECQLQLRSFKKSTFFLSFHPLLL